MGGVVRTNQLQETAKHEDHENLQNCESDSNISTKKQIYIYNMELMGNSSVCVVFTWVSKAIETIKIKVRAWLLGRVGGGINLWVASEIITAWDDYDDLSADSSEDRAHGFGS